MEKLQVKSMLKNFIIDNLGVEESILTDDLQLFDGGICLDSIDNIELISFISQSFGISVAGANKNIFTNIENLADYIYKLI